MGTKIGNNNKIKNANFIEKADINIEVKEKKRKIKKWILEASIHKFNV